MVVHPPIASWSAPPGRDVNGLLVDTGPYFIERLEPFPESTWMMGRTTGQVLVDVVMGVDEPWGRQATLGSR